MTGRRLFALPGILGLSLVMSFQLIHAQQIGVTSADTLEISIPDSLQAFPGEIVSVPVYLGRSANGISSLGAAIKATNGLLRFIDYTPGPIVPGSAIQLSSPQPDSVRMAFVDFGDGPIVEAGLFTSLDFVVDSTAMAGESASLRFQDLSASDSMLTRLVLVARPGKVTVKMVVSVGGTEEPVPRKYHLAQNYPNPFNPSTVIRYDVPRSSHVQLEVFNLLGERIRVPVDSFKSAGSYQLEFNSGDLPSGTYLYRLKSGGYVETKKMVLMR